MNLNKDFMIEQPLLVQEDRISTFTAVLHKEDDTYVAECPEVGTVSLGKTVEEAVSNLKEAIALIRFLKFRKKLNEKQELKKNLFRLQD